MMLTAVVTRMGRNSAVVRRAERWSICQCAWVSDGFARQMPAPDVPNTGTIQWESGVRAPLSIIVPTLNSGDELPSTLDSLGVGLEAGLVRELVVSDGGSEDSTRFIADSAGAILVTGPASRGGQLKRGAAAAGGEWLLFLHADTWLDDCWPDTITAHMRRFPDSAGYFHLAFRSSGLAPRLVAGWANIRSRGFGLPYGDQGLLVSRELYREIGGFTDIPLMEDIALARALRGRLRALPTTARTSAERYLQRGWFRRGSRNLGILIQYLLGADPERLSRTYLR